MEQPSLLVSAPGPRPSFRTGHSLRPQSFCTCSPCPPQCPRLPVPCTPLGLVHAASCSQQQVLRTVFLSPRLGQSLCYNFPLLPPVVLLTDYPWAPGAVVMPFRSSSPHHQLWAPGEQGPRPVSVLLIGVFSGLGTRWTAWNNAA